MHELNLTCLEAVEELCKREKLCGILDTISDSASARVVKASKTLLDMIIYIYFQGFILSSLSPYSPNH